MLEKVSLWKSQGQTKGEKVITSVVGYENNISP